jgi:aspartyl-tRNA synthetase
MISNAFSKMNTDLGEFPVMAYADAMHRYGSDKPDLRVNMGSELTDVMADVDFKVFNVLQPIWGAAWWRTRGGRLKMPLTLWVQSYTEFVKIRCQGWPGSRSMTFRRRETQSPIVKNIHDAAIAEFFLKRTSSQRRLLFFGLNHQNCERDSVARCV